MNHASTEFDDLAPADRAFARAAHRALRASESLDYVESARLAAARRQPVGRGALPAPSPSTLIYLGILAA